ncbi:helix-turn-helix domain-containing protein [Chryseolinea sp. T2]|uniref:helix-turn-helix domain-containing protein n=1 Tax=Chryseolinea sp. T2 TaxID=3129255 RepID=UPI003076B402
MRSVADDDFLEKLKREINDNLTNEQFSVEALAKNIGMSRSQLHRRLNSVTGKSVSQFVREHRLSLGMAMLRDGDLTAAEVSDRIGFGSPTYFSKCFNEFYGFPPGEVKYKTSSHHPETTTLTAVAPEADSPEALHSLAENAHTDFPKPTVAAQPLYRRTWVMMFVSTLVVAICTVIVYRYFIDDDQSANSATIAVNPRSIAILPFKNLSEDERNEYFGEGVVEAIRTSLSSVSALRVISRTSVEQYRKTDKSAKDIAGELSVGALLEGSVQRSESAVRIEVRLVDGLTEAQIWAKTYDRELKDLFAIQTEIAQQVAEELHAKLTIEERNRLSATDTRDPRAYDLYLKGTYELRMYTNRGTHKAIELLEQAIELDPNYARAYAYLAFSHICLAAIFGVERSALEGLRDGKPFIDKALAIDPKLDIAHMCMGFYYLYHDWDIKRVEAEYKQAVVYGNPDALAMYCDFLNFVRRHDEALVFAEKLNETDPYYPNTRMVLSYYYTHRYEDAQRFSEQRLQLFNNYYTFDSHGFLMLQLGHYDDAIKSFNKAIAIEGIRYPRMLGWMAAAYAKAGKPEAAHEIIKELKARLKKGDDGAIAFFIAVAYSALDDKKAALEWLNTAFVSHDMEMPWIMTEPQFNVLHNEPEFKRIAAAVGF